ncbi:MAG: DJ-1/PfpI family protein [Thermoproteota archaeon]|nr:MAG: DJ-1/PfpI family protein [Candidatus Korarchaeota archaeon]
MVKVCILVDDGVEELDFVGVYEVLADVRKVSKHYVDVMVVTFRGKDKVKCRNGLIIVPHRFMRDFSECRVLVIPGGRDFVENALSDEELLKAIRRFYEQKKLIASVCTGSLILAKAGILKGKKATTHHLRMNMLRELGAIPVNKRVVIDDNVITSGGITASIDLGLKLVEVLLGEELRNKIAKYIEYHCYREQ